MNIAVGNLKFENVYTLIPSTKKFILLWIVANDTLSVSPVFL